MYGYKMHPTERNKIVVDEEVAPIVRRIFALALSGDSCRQIARRLNAEGVPTPAAHCGWQVGRHSPFTGMWSSERISEMLRNETYIGNMVQGRTVKVNYKSQKCFKQAPENWVVVEGTHEPLVDAETFRKVGMLLDSRRHTRRHTRSRTYVTHSGEGEGLLFYGNVILPFVDRFPQDTELYRIMTTKFSDGAGDAG